MIEYNSAYNLDLNMRKQIRMEGGMKGYIVLYQSGARIRYNTDTTIISVENMHTIKSTMTSLAFDSSNDGRWIFVSAKFARAGYELRSDFSECPAQYAYLWSAY